MTTLASKIFRLPKQSFVVLFLFCTITLCLESKVNAQQPTPANTPLQSPTPSPTPTASLEERISKLEEQVQRPEGKPKDFWDKAEAISGWASAVSVLVSGVLVALIGAIATYVYDKRQQKNEEAQRTKELALAEAQHQREIKVSQVQTTTSLMPQLQSRYLEDVELAITLVMALGEVKLAMDLLEQYETGVAIPIFKKFLSSPNSEAAKQAEESLSRYLKKLKLIEVRNKLLKLVLRYEQTYKNESYSHARTAKLEVIISKMRLYALAAFPLLPQLLSLIKTTRKDLPTDHIRLEDEDDKLIANLDEDENKLIEAIKEIKYEEPYDENLNQEIEYMEQKKIEEKLTEEDMKKSKRDILDRLVNGIRLAVVAIVQVQPSFDYLDWLAKLLAKEEDSFLGYHAAVALSNAVDVLKKFHSVELKTAIKLAQDLGEEFYGDISKINSFQVLIQAEKKLEEFTN